jgi:hypothetical protein
VRESKNDFQNKVSDIIEENIEEVEGDLDDLEGRMQEGKDSASILEQDNNLKLFVLIIFK